ncbi:MAG: prohibitin family protein [Myxococcales bacterium]|nr:prohibitin family protein [Myxococcales bacterium]
MTLLVLGGVLLVAAAVLRSVDSRLIALARVFNILGPLLILGAALLSALVAVDAGVIGVVKLFGKVSPEVLAPGLHLVNPLANVVHVDGKTRNYTMSAIHDEGALQGDDAIRALTSDGLEVVIDMTVLYRVVPSEAPKLLSEVGVNYEENVIRPIARSRVRDAAVYYQAVQLYTEKRDEFQVKITESITAELAARSIVVEGVLLRNLSLPASVKTTIESKIQAEQESQKMVFVLQKEQQEAERKRVEAQGIADYQRIIAASLNDNQLRYEQIKAYKELATSANAKVIVMNGDTPIILGGL